MGVAVSPDGTRVYVGDNSQSLNVLHVIDTATLRVVAAVPTGRGSHGIAVSPDGKRVYVVNLEGTLSIVDATNNTLAATLRTGSDSLGVSVNPSGTRAYVTSFSDGNVIVIDTSTHTEVTRIRVGGRPVGYGVFIGPPQAATTDALEYYNAEFDHYFVTAGPSEIADLESGHFEGWVSTGKRFKVYRPANTPTWTAPVCRFFSTKFGPKSSHFYTPSATECTMVQGNPN